MDKLQPKAIIFDLGCTLIEYETISWEELGKFCARNVHAFISKSGFELPEGEEFCRMFEEVKNEYRQLANEKLVEWTIPQAAQRLLKRLNISENNGFLDRLFDAYYKPVAERIYVYDDTLEVLQRLRKKFSTIGLISNTIFPEEAHLGELRRFGIQEYLDFTIFSSTFGVRKPHPDIFISAANQAGYAPSECVYIGDRYREDVLGPNSVGMPAILKRLPVREYPADMPESTRTIRTLSELSEHLDI